MAKGRHLKPDFFTDKNIVSLTPLARLLYQGLWCHAADCGHIDDEPMEFKLRILPADNCDVEELLRELAEQGRIVRSDGVISLPTLREHARIDTRYETACDACSPRVDNPVDHRKKGLHKRWHTDRGVVKNDCDFCVSEHPEIAGSEGVDGLSPHSDHVVTTLCTRSDHVVDGDGDGDGDLSTIDSATAPSIETDRFDEFWTIYDKKIGRKNAEAKWRKALKKRGVTAELLIESAKAYIEWQKSEGKHPEYTKHPATWLNGEHWADERPGRSPQPQQVFLTEVPPDGLTPPEYRRWVEDARARAAGKLAQRHEVRS